MFCTLSKLNSKPTKDLPIHSRQNITGYGMLTKLMRYFRRIYLNLRLEYYDYVLLLLIASLILQHWLAFLLTSG